MSEKTIRVVTRETDGSLRTRDLAGFEELHQSHEQIGIDDSSTDLTLRGLPLFRGLIGPIPEGRSVARYESPEVFEVLTKEWAAQKAPRRRRRKAAEIQAEREAQEAAAAGLDQVENLMNQPENWT